MATNSKKIRVRLKAYEHDILDLSAAKIVALAKKTKAGVVGPIPLPTEKRFGWGILIRPMRTLKLWLWATAFMK